MVTKVFTGPSSLMAAMAKAGDACKRAFLWLSTCMTSFMLFGVRGYAGGYSLNTDADDSTAANIVGTIIDKIVAFFPFVGAFFVLIGAFKVVNGFRNENNPEAIAGGAKDIVIGVVLIAFGTLIWNNISPFIFSSQPS